MIQSKQCSNCKQIKLLECFSPDKRVPSGCQSKCKSCTAEYRRLAYAKNPAHFKKLVADSVKRNYKKKLQRNNEYRTNNPDKVSSWKKKDRTTNKVRVNSDNAMRRAKINGLVNSDIMQVYALRDFYTAMSLGEKFHVDHVVPLVKGGQHHVENLQIIPAIDNLRKGAR